MRRCLFALIVFSTAAAVTASPLIAQQQASFAETPKSKRIDETYATATAAATKAYEKAREKEVGAWLRSYERALADAKSAGDVPAAAYLSKAIALTQQAGYVVKPAPPGAKPYEGHGYLFVGDAVTFHAARKRCEALGGHLVTVESQGEAAFLLENWSDKDFWIGAGDFAEEGNYRWINGAPFDSHGYQARFSNWRGFKHALAWSAGDRGWLDVAEGYPLRFVCEWDQ